MVPALRVQWGFRTHDLDFDWNNPIAIGSNGDYSEVVGQIIVSFLYSPIHLPLNRFVLQIELIEFGRPLKVVIALIQIWRHSFAHIHAYTSSTNQNLLYACQSCENNLSRFCRGSYRFSFRIQRMNASFRPRP